MRAVPGPRRDMAASADAARGTPVVIATILRGDGVTGVDTHVRQVGRYLRGRGDDVLLVTPFSWARPLGYPLFGIRRLVLHRVSGSASLAWYLHWHEVFLHRALKRTLGQLDECVVYAQDPFAARAALRARRGPRQRIVMAVHLRTSMADEWADKEEISRGGSTFQAIRDVERSVIPAVDGLIYVSNWAREALLGWLPAAGAVPSAVIGNFVTPWTGRASRNQTADLVTVGNLDLVKNHRFLLQVLAEARRRGSVLSLDIFGDGPCRADLVVQARALGVERQVRLLGFRSDVRDFLPGYKAYVHASYSESSSLAIMEAMAAGLPIVAADTGPISELCDDGVEARFWPLDDPAQAAAVLVGFLADEPERRRTAEAALDRFHQTHDAEVVGPRLRSFLLETSPRAGAPVAAAWAGGSLSDVARWFGLEGGRMGPGGRRAEL